MFPSAARAAVLLLGLTVLWTATACDSSRPPQSAQDSGGPESEPEEGVIVAVGDSLTAGLGLPEAEAYPAILEQLLAERGFNYRVVNAGISGETSSGARTRIGWIMKLEPDIVILETGANDGLRGIEPKLVEENIDHIITQLLQEDITVVLAGMQMVTNLGPAYVSSFNRVYPKLADRHGVIFMPFFLQDVAMNTALNQADGIHPNAAGYEVIAENLLPFVEEAIKETAR